MHLTPLENLGLSSGNVHAIGWQANTEIAGERSEHGISVNSETIGMLSVEFYRSGVYQYANVPREVYEAVLASASVGRALRALVTSQPYPWRKAASTELAGERSEHGSSVVGGTG